MLVTALSYQPTAQEAALPDGTPLILWESIVTTSNVTATNEDPNYPATNLANHATNQEWRAHDSGSPVDLNVELHVTNTDSDTIDAVGIARHNFGTDGITAEVGYYLNDSPDHWVSLAGPTSPTTDEPLLFRFNASAYAKIFVKLTQGSASARAAVLYVGKLLVMERGVDVSQDFAMPRFARVTEAVNPRSERGDFLGRIPISQYLDGIEHSYSNLTAAWYSSYAVPFVLAAQQDTPFFYAFSPDDDTDEVAYCWFTSDPVPMTNPVTKLKRLVMKMGGLVE